MMDEHIRSVARLDLGRCHDFEIIGIDNDNLIAVDWGDILHRVFMISLNGELLDEKNHNDSKEEPISYKKNPFNGDPLTGLPMLPNGPVITEYMHKEKGIFPDGVNECGKTFYYPDDEIKNEILEILKRDEYSQLNLSKIFIIHDRIKFIYKLNKEQSLVCRNIFCYVRKSEELIVPDLAGNLFPYGTYDFKGRIPPVY